jgi:aromatic-L-amino-acid decarboxylase
VTPEQFRSDGAAAIEWVASYLERLRDFPVLAQVAPGDLRRSLPASAPERGEPFAAVLADLDRLILPAVTHWQHPRYFAYYPSTASEPAILAELLAAALNQVAFLWRSSPASTELELHVMDWLRELLGLAPGWHGHIEDTASTVTMAALIAARHATGRDAVVASEHAHSSVEKAARMLRMELVRIPSDREHAMRADAVADALAGRDAAVVVATVGTTSSAAVDPVPAIADACEGTGTWLHVDAAYAGAAWLCPEHRWSQAGVERADTLVVNPQKWLSVPMDCSAFWTRRPGDLRNAFSLVPEYLRTADEAESLSDYGPALGRRFRSLKLWALLRCYGREGLQARIRESIRLGEVLERWIREEPGWEIVAPRHLSLVCFRRDAADEENERIMNEANATGTLFLSHTRLDGRFVLRMAIGNPRTTEDDVRLAWDVLRRTAGGRS